MKEYTKNLGKVVMTPKGAWSIEKEYEILDIIYDSVTEHAYISKQEVPSGVDLSDSRYWMPLNVSGYSDSNVIALNNFNEDGEIQSYTLEEAIKTIKDIGRKSGAILIFYNDNVNRLDITTGCWEIWQFNSINIYDWENLDSWVNIYYNYNKFVGWYAAENVLNKEIPNPDVGCYAFVGNVYNESFVYRCDVKNRWTKTNQKAQHYIKIVFGDNVIIGDNGCWWQDGVDTNIPVSIKGDNGLTPYLRWSKNNQIEYSYDNINWHILSDKFDTNIKIKDYVNTINDLPNNVELGTIYGVGPVYAEDDVEHINPIYNLYVYTSNGWVNNGEFKGISAGVVQEKGTSTTEVMSQDAVTRELIGLELEVGVFSNILSVTDDNAGFLKLGKTFNAGEKIIIKLLEVEPAIKVSIVLTYDNNSVQSLGNLTKKGDFITATCDSQVNGIYFSAIENITAQLYVANYGANQKIENTDKVVKEIYNDNKLQDVAIGTLERWDIMPKYTGQLSSTSINESDISYYKILKIAPNDEVLIKANVEEASLIAILKSIDFTDLSQLDFASGFDGRISIKAATSSKFTMPDDANYIIVACLWNGQDRTPSDIQINGKSIIYKEEYITEKKLSAIYLGVEKRHVLQSIEWGNGVISSDGSENNSSTFIKTDFIDVSGIDLLRIDINQDTELFTTIGLYDRDKQFIKRLSTRVSTQIQFNGNLKDNADCHYVKISANTTDIALLTISVDVLSSRFFNRRLLGNKNIKSFSHAGSSLSSAVTAGSNLPSSMWGTYLNGFDVIHCNVRYTTDNIGYCLHDETFVDEVSGNTITLGNVSSDVIEACRVKGQPLAKVESVIYLAKMMGLDVCLYNIYGRLDHSVISDIVRMAKTYGMFEHIYFGITYSDVGLQYLNAIYAEYPKAKILLTQSSISTIDYSQITEVLSRAKNVLSTRPELDVYLWINSGYDIADYERLNLEKPYNIKVGCYKVTKEQESTVLPYMDIYTSANGLRSFGIARRDIEVAVTNKYPEFLMGDYGNII